MTEQVKILFILHRNPAFLKPSKYFSGKQDQKNLYTKKARSIIQYSNQSICSAGSARAESHWTRKNASTK